jgi:outer membrane protein OmpA-like peptidoglycan-associated protein
MKNRKQCQFLEPRHTVTSRLWRMAGLLFGLLFAISVQAQNGNESAPRYEFGGSYSYVRANAGNYGASFSTLGLSSSSAFNLNPRLGVVSDVGFYRFSGLPSGITSNMYTFMSGPQLSFRRYERIQPFVHVLVGVGHLNASRDSIGVHAAENGFAFSPGGGADLFLKPGLAVRLFQFDYLRTNYDRSNGLGTNQNNWRISTGIVFRRGAPRTYKPSTDLPPTLSCFSDPSSVYADALTSARIWTSGSAADGSALSFDWNSSAGEIVGSGPEVRWRPNQVAPGSYIINVRAADTHGRAARCSLDIAVLQRPNRPPVVACSVDQRALEQGAIAKLVATASDPDGDPVTISWSSDGGKLESVGTNATFDTGSLKPGAYSVVARATDGRGGSAECSVDLTVNQAISAALKPLEARLALHSIYFPTDQPTRTRPTTGLVLSQQRMLRSIATDFKKYLESKPEARLILQGHADQRGAEDYNLSLSSRRVESVRSYLATQGVPNSQIEILAFGRSKNLSETEVRQLVDENSDLSPEERSRALANMHTIVLANNRRVDIVLSTVLQQSERRYPFKVEDALSLIREGRANKTDKTGKADKAEPKKVAANPE